MGDAGVAALVRGRCGASDLLQSASKLDRVDRLVPEINQRRFVQSDPLRDKLEIRRRQAPFKQARTWPNADHGGMSDIHPSRRQGNLDPYVVPRPSARADPYSQRQAG